MTAGPIVPPSYPQFWDHVDGPYGWDVDGTRHIDLLCGFGPMVLGYRNPVVESAAAAQAAYGDTMTGPSARMVELAELLTDTVAHADWSMFAKNGTDATAIAVRIARAATGKTKLLKATPAYHGANDWFTPMLSGVAPGDRANIDYFDYNDLASLEAKVAEHSGDIAAIILTPFQHDSRKPQEFVDPEFARAARTLTTGEGAVLILDEVRTGIRLDLRGAWETIGVRPDLTAYSKAIANGHPIAAVVGIDALKEAASSVYVTGSFWYSAVPMAAAKATIEHALAIDAPARIASVGELLKRGIEEQGAHLGAYISGPLQMPYLSFADDPSLAVAMAFTDSAIRHGVLMHPWHTMFLSTAHTEDVIDDVSTRTARAFEEIAALKN
ncbi:MAG: aminotransferase class III-fold pyridoxal phosphate-dependent enzyme [Cumulibacter sp.]